MISGWTVNREKDKRPKTGSATRQITPCFLHESRHTSDEKDEEVKQEVLDEVNDAEIKTHAGDEKDDDSVKQVVLPDEVNNAEEEHVKHGQRHLIPVEQYPVERVTVVWNSRKYCLFIY